jgi:2-keto-4-pentenoate hydratase/2-oxohepta-3-ene-1,7-dioic acid hydratase in catechol pathway
MRNHQISTGSNVYLIFNFDTLICHISRYFTIQKSDLIFTGTPAGVGPVQIGDVLEGFIEDRHMVTCAIR